MSTTIGRKKAAKVTIDRVIGRALKLAGPHARARRTFERLLYLVRSRTDLLRATLVDLRWRVSRVEWLLEDLDVALVRQGARRARGLKEALLTHAERRGGPTALVDELRPLLVDVTAAHPSWVAAHSPTRRVGHAPLSAFAKVVRAVPMLSLDNTYSESDLRRIDWPAYRMSDWDYVLIRTRPDSTVRDVPAALTPVAHEGGWWLFRTH